MQIPFDCTQVFFATTHHEAIMPSKRPEDSSYDLYAVDANNVTIAPHTTVKLRTGIVSAFSPKYRVKIEPRGTTAKAGLMINAGVVDSGYRGEWFVSVVNTNDVPVQFTDQVNEVLALDSMVLYPVTKAVAQFKIDEVPVLTVVSMAHKEILQFESERGDGAEGSSKK